MVAALGLARAPDDVIVGHWCCLRVSGGVDVASNRAGLLDATSSAWMARAGLSPQASSHVMIVVVIVVMVVMMVVMVMVVMVVVVLLGECGERRDAKCGAEC
jgi:hypothetical protein